MCSAGGAMAGENTGSYSSRSLGPNGETKTWKTGDVANTGGIKGIDYVFTGKEWIKKI
tara:strand:+ start:271 stop:444 length:174 start_codon:yes stop_codon:yes gene_type:complete